jgi:O-glycosyl hydrolase
MYALTGLCVLVLMGGEFELPPLDAPAEGEATPFEISAEARDALIWGRGTEPARAYFEQFLPAVFRRTLRFEKLHLPAGALEWIFTGDHGGFTVRLTGDTVSLVQRFYDSFAFNPITDGQVRAARHPEKQWRESSVLYQGELRQVAVILDHKLGLAVELNGTEALRQQFRLDVSRHQLRVTDARAICRGLLVRPSASPATIHLDPKERHQTVYGFGGIATPTAYAQLSTAGKRRWWEILCEYNLLVQREYPIGTRLKPDMSNWDTLADATPHYYGDNFPNGEISDFTYLKTLHRLGGKVFFQFWRLPPWATREDTSAAGKRRRLPDIAAYTKAMVSYCATFREKVGAPPDVVGIQNEVVQPPEVWHAMTLALRRELDRAGFSSVKIHMSDNGHLAGGIRNARAFTSSKACWAAIDYAATHMYDYQSHFTDPDRYDTLLAQWKQLTGDKPFLSTELCINRPAYQLPTYRMALAMGQLYQKNLVLTDAIGICYCWTILNVVQPSYGATRSLFVPDRSHGFVPAPSSHQLRVFGAYSRRIKAGMVRVGATSDSRDCLAAAFCGKNGKRTVVVLNRSPAPMTVRIENAGGGFAFMEIADPYRENQVRPAPPATTDGATIVPVEPGAFVTLSTVPLGKLPDDVPLPTDCRDATP